MNDATITAEIVTAALALDWGSIVSRGGKITAVPLGIEVHEDEMLADYFGVSAGPASGIVSDTSCLPTYFGCER